MGVGVGWFEGLSLLAHSIALLHLANVTLCAGAQRARQLHLPLYVSASDLQRDGGSRMEGEYETDEGLPATHLFLDLPSLRQGFIARRITFCKGHTDSLILLGLYVGVTLRSM